MKVSAKIGAGGKAVTLKLKTPHGVASTQVPAVWFADHSRDNFEPVTFQRRDPKLPVDAVIDQAQVAADSVAVQARLKHGSKTAVFTVPTEAVAAAVAADPSTPDALAREIGRLVPPKSDLHRALGYTSVHTAFRRANVQQPPSAAVLLAHHAAQQLDPVVWDGAAALNGRYRLPCSVIPARGDTTHTVEEGTRALRATVAKYGFAVARDAAFYNGVTLPPGTTATDIKLNGTVTPNAEPPANLDERFAARVDGMAALVQASYGVVRWTHYGGVSTWGDARIEPEAEPAVAAAVSAPTPTPQPAPTKGKGAKKPRKKRGDTSDPEHLDTAYLKHAIGLHTDSTYFVEPPKLQIFGCLHKSPVHTKGGDNIIADGFAVAEILRSKYPADYKILTSTPVTAFYCKEGMASVGVRPVIAEHRGSVVQVSYNRYDRSPLQPCGGAPAKPNDLTAFMRAYLRFGELIDAHAVRVAMDVGELVAFDNHRVLHARDGFSGPRIMCGAYVGLDDYISAVAATALAAQA